jgi:2-polyprenyl-3-methyl-5-hydroxy-6-metoxy-1,4-benzoquinol methylase
MTRARGWDKVVREANRLLRRLRRMLGLSHPALEFTSTQELFCEWNAERLGITLEESRERYRQSWELFREGHTGQQFYDFTIRIEQALSVFYRNDERECFGAYGLLGPMHFLRMLSYREPHWPADHPLIVALTPRQEARILDFGCGLAQLSRTLAQTLRAQGKTIRLVLADIPTIRKEFLLWTGKRTGIPTTFLDCTAEQPTPDLPPHDICVATEFFEHVHDLVAYFAKLDAALRPGGYLVTNVADHKADPGHVSPTLGPLREEIARRGYRTVVSDRLFRKPERPPDFAPHGI